MNAEQFYDEFKDMLRFLGPGWSGRELINVQIVNGKFVMSYGAKSVSILLLREASSVDATLNAAQPIVD